MGRQRLEQPPRVAGSTISHGVIDYPPLIEESPVLRQVERLEYLRMQRDLYTEAFETEQEVLENMRSVSAVCKPMPAFKYLELIV